MQNTIKKFLVVSAGVVVASLAVFVLLGVAKDSLILQSSQTATVVGSIPIVPPTPQPFTYCLNGSCPPEYASLDDCYAAGGTFQTCLANPINPPLHTVTGTGATQAGATLTLTTAQTKFQNDFKKAVLAFDKKQQVETSTFLYNWYNRSISKGVSSNGDLKAPNGGFCRQFAINLCGGRHLSYPDYLQCIDDEVAACTKKLGGNR
ncbi:MAG: hypothetical protein NTZ44_00905 [Candidatus Nomurabacteria bacterium]|nr:hypothetical protein [Candidatus Nomurabacteria bacterium]